MFNYHKIWGRLHGPPQFCGAPGRVGGDEREDGVVTPSARIGGINIQFRVAARNLHKVKLANQLGANVYDILKHEKLVLTLPALRALEERLG